MSRGLHLALVSALCIAAPSAALAEPEDVAALLEPVRKQYRLPALAGAVVRGAAGEVVAIGATGKRRRGRSAKVTVDDKWHLGSCTKAMTATLVAREVERGRLRWDTTVAQGLPGLAEEMHADYRPVVLTALLRHRAGMPGDITKHPIWSWLWTHDGPTEVERRTVVETVLRERPEVRPGSEFRYSNAGYTVAGAVVEQASGATWEERMRADLFEPLGMQSAGFGAPGTPGRLDQPWGHREDGTPLDPGDPQSDNPPAIGPAVSVHASLRDWARFVGLHLDAGDELDYLSASSYRTLQTPLPGSEAALGWFVTERPWGGGAVLNHAGSNTMWYVVVWMAPLRDFAVLVATNQGGDRAEKAAGVAVDELIGVALRRRPDR